MKNLAELSEYLDKLDSDLDEVSKLMERSQTNLALKEFKYDIKKESESFKAKSEKQTDVQAKATAILESQDERRAVIRADAVNRKYKRLFYQLLREKETCTTQGNNIRKEYK